MSDREDPFANEEFYHVYNRGVAKQSIFMSESDYRQAMLTLDYYRFVKLAIKLSRFKRLSSEEKSKHLSVIDIGSKLVEIIAFVFMPNHFHMLLQQNVYGGISKYMSLFANSYTRYFNTKFKRVGAIFQGAFKSVHVQSGEQLIHLSRYIHLNPYVSNIVKKDNLPDYPWSSLPEYLSKDAKISDISEVLSYFGDKHSYRNFIFDHADYARELEIVKHQTIDIEG